MLTDRIRITPKWNKSKEQIWAERFQDLDNIPPIRIIPFYRRKVFSYAIAMAICVLMTLPTIAFLYTKEIRTFYGEHKLVVLPDQSLVQINADSYIIYKPYWWKVFRSVELGGEAYFDVQKGSTLSVVSGDRRVSVLGTSFNIYARKNRYIVCCLSGKVQVCVGAESNFLTQGMRASFDSTRLVVTNDLDIEKSIGWLNGEFSFTSVPLVEVLEEIERQYNIKIEKPKNNDYLYTGSFSRKHNPTEILEIIGKPFNLKLRIIE